MTSTLLNIYSFWKFFTQKILDFGDSRLLYIGKIDVSPIICDPCHDAHITVLPRFSNQPKINFYAEDAKDVTCR